MTMQALIPHSEPRTIVEAPPRFRPGERICPGMFACRLLADGRRSQRWLAWSAPLWTQVVVKLPREERLGRADAARRLGKEARTLRRLTHPGIQRLLDDGHADPIPHLVLEHVDGPTLAGVLDERGRLTAADVVHVGMQVAAVLHYLHDWGLVHLGLRPAGLALRDGRVILLDLESARPAGRRVPRPCPPGCQPYLAPERCAGAPASPLMDLFALGAVLYEAATGGPAFTSDDVGPGCRFPQLLTSPARARLVVPSLPAGLDAALHALLERDARRRPQTALETLRLLAAAMPADEATMWPPFVSRLLGCS